MDTLHSHSPPKDDKDPEVDVNGEWPSLDTADNSVLAHLRKTHCVSSTVCSAIFDYGRARNASHEIPMNL